jgi:hypothetical protein
MFKLNASDEYMYRDGLHTSGHFNVVHIDLPASINF